MSGNLPNKPFLAFARAYGAQMELPGEKGAASYWQAAVEALRAYEMERARDTDDSTT